MKETPASLTIDPSYDSHGATTAIEYQPAGYPSYLVPDMYALGHHYNTTSALEGEDPQKTSEETSALWHNIVYKVFYHDEIPQALARRTSLDYII